MSFKNFIRQCESRGDGEGTDAGCILWILFFIAIMLAGLVAGTYWIWGTFTMP